MFKTLKIKNFLSWSELQIDFESGVTLIEGWNYDDKTPEGSGKSAIPNALVWAIYGKLPKDSKIDDVIKEGQKSCSVEVELLDGTKILRTRKPNDLSIYFNSTDGYIRGKDAKETQEFIEKRVGFGFETFCQTIYFAQNYPKKFITANEEEKAKILSELQDLEIFDKARKTAHEELKRVNSDISTLSNDITLVVNDLNNEIQSIEDMENMKLQNIEKFDNKKKMIEDSITRTEKAIKELKVKLKSLNKESEEYDKEAISVEIDKLIKYKTEIEISLNNLDKEELRKERLVKSISNIEKKLSKLDNELSKLEDTTAPQCPTCGTELSDKSKLESHIKSLEKQFNETEAEGDELTKQLEEFDEIDKSKLEKTFNKVQYDENQLRKVLKSINNEEFQNKQINLEIQKLNGKLETLVDEFNNLEGPNNETLDKHIKSKKVQIEKNEKTLKRLEKQFKQSKDLASKLSLLKDSFRAVKSYVFQTVLHDLTVKSNRYLSSLFNQDVKIKFSNTGEGGEVSKINVAVTIDGKDRPLGLYSGGQSRRIQLAVDLALSDILASRSNNPVNFRILDEYFRDLSEVSMENILTLLESLKGTTLLIEHNSLFKNIVSNSIKVELRGGTSNMVELEYGIKELDMQNLQTGN